MQSPQNLHNKSQAVGEADNSSCLPLVSAKLLSPECEREPLANIDGQPEHSEQSVAGAANHKVLHVATWSAGSKAHDVGDCRPCAYYWKLDGCNK